MLILTISTLLKIGFVLTLLLGIAPLLVWAERRQSSMMQDRVGPVRGGIPLPRVVWTIALVAAVALILGGWLLDGTVTPLFLVFGGHDLALADGTMVYAWTPVLGPILQLGLDNPGLYQAVVILSLLMQVGGVVLLLTALFFKDRLSVSEFIKGPFAMGAKAVAALAAGVAILALEQALQYWFRGLVDFWPLPEDATMTPGAYLGVAFVAALVAVVHVALAWIVENSVDKRGHLTVFGLIHPAFDAVKMIWKEDFAPPRADKLLYSAAPIIATIPVFATFAVIPFGPDLQWGPEGDAFKWLFSVIPSGAAMDGTTIPLQVANINVGILYMFAIAGAGIVGAAIAGYSSDNKYSLLGGLRAASQMVSYEVTLGLTLVGCFMVYGTLLLDQMVAWQQAHVWGFIAQPLALILFFFAVIAEMKRVPFDAPEGESEIVAGYFLEYSGMKFGMFMMGEFLEHVVSSGLIVTLFFGGYDLPFLHQDGFQFDFAGFDVPLPHVLVILVSVAVFVLKMGVVMFLQLQVRWTLPRFRYDQIMKLCWKIILPLSLANILVTGIVILMFQ
jgi:NADH-quinone oxidoreductase subunit H